MRTPTPTSRPSRRAARGMTLLEVMIALVVLLVGLLGMMKLQILGITSNAGARAQTTASQLATELAGALAALPFEDARLAGTADTTAPTPFGRLLGADLSAENVHEWSDDASMAGVRLDAGIEADPLDPSRPLYRRRWSVWDLADTASGGSATKVIAVSVVYHERGNATPREVVVLAQRSNPGLALSFAAAYR